MSTPSSFNPRGGPYRRPRPDLYTALLVLALMAILAAIFVLYAEMGLYEYKFKGGPAVSVARDAAVAMLRVQGSGRGSCLVLPRASIPEP